MSRSRAFNVQQLAGFDRRHRPLVVAVEPRLTVPIDHPEPLGCPFGVWVARISDDRLEGLLAREHVLPSLLRLIQVSIRIDRCRHLNVCVGSSRHEFPTPLLIDCECFPAVDAHHATCFQLLHIVVAISDAAQHLACVLTEQRRGSYGTWEVYRIAGTATPAGARSLRSDDPTPRPSAALERTALRALRRTPTPA